MLELLHRTRGVVERDGADAHEARVASAEGRHGAVVGPGSAVAQVAIGAGVEDLPRAERGEHELPREPETVERLCALARIERPESQIPLGPGDELVAQSA